MKRDVGSYYDQTQNHYERWWGLNKSMALHYGIWDQTTHSFPDALRNTNQILSAFGSISEGDHVLDAGCGVGGSCIYLAKEKSAIVKGITLSDKQVITGKRSVIKNHLQSRVEIFKMDFTKTTFNDHSFDVIWACESLSSLENKPLFVREAHRILKPNGKLVIADFYRSKKESSDLLEKWSKSWAMAELTTLHTLKTVLTDNGFVIHEERDYTKEIFKSSKRLYLASLIGKYPSMIYNVLFGASFYARNHYKSGIHQFKALQKELWKYHILHAEKR